MGVLIRLVLTAIAGVICAWPAWLYLFADSLLDPNGFWQNLVLVGFGVWFLLGAQILFLLVFIVLLIPIWAS